MNLLSSILLASSTALLVACGATDLRAIEPMSQDQDQASLGGARTAMVSLDDNVEALENQDNSCQLQSDTSDGLQYLFLRTERGEGEVNTDLGFAIAFPVGAKLSAIENGRFFEFPLSTDFRFSGFILQSPLLYDREFSNITLRKYEVSEGIESQCSLRGQKTNNGFYSFSVNCIDLRTFVLTGGPTPEVRSSTLSLTIDCSAVVKSEAGSLPLPK